MKRIVLILLLVPVLLLSGNSAPVETNEVGEPITPDYTTWQKDVKNVMMDLKDVPEDFFEPAQEGGNLQYFQYKTKNYDRDMAEETKYAVVYTPYQYSSDKQYDILYLMHGYAGDINTWLGSPGDPGEMKYVLDHMIADHKIAPLIVVCPTYYDNNKNEETDNMDTGLLEPFGQELRNDLIPAVETAFSTYAVTTDEQGLQDSGTHRAFGGFSMGGVTTLYRMMDCMDIFSCFIDFSGPIYWSSLVNSQTGDWGASYLKEKITEQGYTDKDFHLYLATGSQDEAYPLMDTMIESLLKQNDLFHVGLPGKPGINVTYGVCDGEIHDWHNRARCLYNILPMLSDHMNGTDLRENRHKHGHHH
ncbi:MAG: alpha/beta hydrolase [Lactimicrobium massiliense]